MAKHRKPVRRNPPRRNPGNPIDTATAVAVAKAGIEAVQAEGGSAAVAGGLAMLLHGLVRNTTDVDLLASKVPRRFPAGSYIRKLSFGGARYEVEAPSGKVSELDIIVRDDNESVLYRMALDDLSFKRGLPVVSPEWMAVIKFTAGRPKDLGDLEYLVTTMSASGRKRAIKNAHAAGGWYLQQDMENAVEEILWRHSRRSSK